MDLPVTTEAARAAGSELWGLPKFVTRIDFEREGRRFAGLVHDPSGERGIVRLAGELGRSLPLSAVQPVLVSRREGALLRTEISVRGRHRLFLGTHLQLEVQRSSHPMAERMRRLGLGGRPELTIFASRMQALLPLGTPWAERGAQARGGVQVSRPA